MQLRKISNDWFVFHPHSYGIATLMRIGFKFRGRQLVLHHFRPHRQVEFHDHPWSFRTIVLWGGYIDESLDSNNLVIQDRLHWLSMRKRPALHAHRTVSKGHTVTLVLTSEKKRSWCKGSPETWVCGGEVKDFDSTRGMVKV